MTTEQRIAELQFALLVAANALDTAADWGIVDVQIEPPEEWALEAYRESAADGWCSLAELARKIREIAGENS